MLHCNHLPVLPQGTCSFCNFPLPETLLDICVRYINRNLDTICVPWKRTERLKLKRGVHLPPKVYERLLELREISMTAKTSNFIGIFKDRKSTKLRKVRLCKCRNINDKDLKILLEHELAELDISYCMDLSETSLSNLSDYSKNLVSVNINYTRIFRTSVFGKPDKKYYEQGYIFSAPNLRKLTLKHLYDLHCDFYSLLLKSFTLLTHLNLSTCSDLGSFDYVTHLTNLTSLVLYDALSFSGNDNMINAICKLHNLKHLDISHSNIEQGIFQNECQTLKRIVQSLPRLTSMDISGTNLDGPGLPSDIPGLVSRMGSPFQYLGLYGTSHGACRRHDIPAKLIAGNANEEQLLVAGLAFLDRPGLLQKVLVELAQLVRSKTCVYIGHVLHIVLESMNRYLPQRDIQLFGSSFLLAIVKQGQIDSEWSASVKRRVFTAFLNALTVHISDATLLKDMCTIASYFDIPEDVLFDFERLIKILLRPIQPRTFNDKKVLRFLNTLACHVDIPEKIKMGELGVMDKMIRLIERKLEKDDCDEILEFAWTIMWNCTDEAPINSGRFVELNGMECFLRCYQEFSMDADLLSSMMGLLGNVSEVCELHQYLMTTKCVSIFTELLDSTCDGIEVSYNAAGIIAYIASHGPKRWTVKHPDRDSVLEKLDKTIDRWNLKSKRSMMYRSFKPVFYLVKVCHTPQCQKWGIWTLANLTNVDPERYCPMIQKEGGLALLQELMDHSLPPVSVTNLTAKVIENCKEYMQKKQ